MKFLQPSNLEGLAGALGQMQGESYLLSGCTDFLAKRNGKPWDADTLVSVVNVPELRILELRESLLSIGAGCTHTLVEESAVVQRYFPALAQACGNVGSPQIRNRGTVGGSIGNASPAGDIFPVLLMMGAQAVVLNSSGRQRRLPVDALVLGMGKTILARDEAIIAFELPLPAWNNCSVFAKLGERARVTIAKINLAVSLELDGRTIQSAKVVLGAVAKKAFFAESAAKELVDHPLSRDLLRDFTAALSAEIQASISGRASLPYKKEAILGLADDVLTLLIEQFQTKR